MNEEIKMHTVSNDGSLSGELPFDKSKLKSDRVVVIVDENNKKIWIWKGSRVTVKQKFISARLASEIRSEKGIRYKVLTADEDDEPKEFIQLIDIEEVTPTIMEITEPEAETIEEPEPAKEPVEEIVEPTPVEKPEPIPKPAPKVIPKPTPRIEEPKAKEKLIPLDKESIIKELDEFGALEGYKRELVIIGHEAFTVAETKTNFFGKKTLKTSLAKITPPKGTFFAEKYTPRVVVKNGSVIAIEFWKEVAKIEEKVEMKKHLSELIKIFTE